MSTHVTVERPVDVVGRVDVPARRLPVALVLAGHEGVRIVRHPLAVAALLAVVATLVAASRDSAYDAFVTVTTATTWFYGVAVFFVAHLLATRDRRAGLAELVGTTPAPAATRVAALCGAAFVPTALSVAVVAVADAVLTSLDSYAFQADPSFWHLATGPLTVLGGALLGTAVGRWTAVPGAGVVVMVALVLANAWLNGRPEALHLLGPYVSWPVWTDGDWAGLYTGSPGWHVGYLVALCALAGAGCFLREDVARWRVLGAGGAAAALAVVAGVAQLP